jgi:multicomponent Na+:H+ antiporter subunit E
VFIFFASFLMYLLLVWSGGTIAPVEFAVAFLLATILALAARTWVPSYRFSFLKILNPLRWISFLYYVFVPFGIALFKANIDVAIRVITGNIRPGIVKLTPDLKSDLSRMILADSITLTPGTLTVDVDDEGAFYVHWIYVRDENPSEEEIYGSFASWARRLAD